MPKTIETFYKKHAWRWDLYADELLALLTYSPNDGLFRWRVYRHGRNGVIRPGDVAGTVKDGYVQIGVLGCIWRAHILAWFFMIGERPPIGYEIDHWDRDRTNNSWSNFRLVTRSINNHNAEPGISNRSGVRGVSWLNDGTNKWHARIQIGKRIILLGNYINFVEAVEARRSAEFELLGHYVTSLSTESLYTPRLSIPKIRTDVDKEDERMRKRTTTRVTNTSGYRGVRLHKQSGRWHARIVVDYKEISLGYFDTFDEAVVSRQQAEQQLTQ